MSCNRPIPLGHTVGHFIFGTAVGAVLSMIVFFGNIIPNKIASTIDERSTNLNYMQYNGEVNKMVYKEGQMECNKFTFQYLKYGTMKDQTK